MLNRLHRNGYVAYLVGGSVRDLLLDNPPKDFDIVTDALPNEIRKLFRNCRLIGRRFRLAHIYFKDELIEVATFRASHQPGEANDDDQHRRTGQGMIIRDNVYGTIEEDVWRRDFTVNALYYNSKDFTLVDFTNGFADLRTKVLRCIGDPQIRFQEDPVRMLRAIRLSSKLNFTIDPQSMIAINKLGHLLAEVSPSRLFEESLKLFQSGYAETTFDQLVKFDLLRYLCPSLAECLRDPANELILEFIYQVLRNTDARIHQGKTVTPVFLFATFLWQPVNNTLQHYLDDGCAYLLALQKAGSDILREQNKSVTVPRRLTVRIRDIWALQHHLLHFTPKRIWRSFYHPSFRAAYDFLLLRSRTDESLAFYADWWTQFQVSHKEQRETLIDDAIKHRQQLLKQNRKHKK